MTYVVFMNVVDYAICVGDNDRRDVIMNLVQ
jgi:hypothetical protein